MFLEPISCFIKIKYRAQVESAFLIEWLKEIKSYNHFLLFTFIQQTLNHSKALKENSVKYIFLSILKMYIYVAFFIP